MTVGKRIALWAERMGAVVLALFVLAVTVPDLGSIRRLANGRRVWKGGDPLGLVVIVVILAALVLSVVIGQKRSRALRIAGWALLLAVVVGTLRL